MPPLEFPLNDARDFAIDLAAQAADIARGFVDSIAVERKPDHSPVTETDRRIQHLIAHAVAKRYGNHAFVGEETIDDAPDLPSPDRSEYCWVVDPLDGTRNYAHRFPLHCTSIALMRDARPVVAVVYEHVSGWHCSAVIGQGVICNGRPAAPAARPINRDTIIAVPTGRDKSVLPLIKTWIEKYVLRNVGCTALHLAYVATGAVDAALCDECKLWDVAAGALLVTESGAGITDLNGHPFLQDPPRSFLTRPDRDHPFFAATPPVFDTLFAEMNR